MQTLTRTSLLALLAAAPMASVAQPPELMQPQAAQASETQSSWSADRATRLLAYVEQVGADGLNPASYSPDRLRAAMGDEAARSRVADEIFLKLAADLSGGSVRGADRVSWYMAPSGADESERQRMLQRAKGGDPAAVLNGLLPKHPQYALLKNALTKPENAARRDLIRTNMERWRWLPRNLGERHIIVNVPAYTAAIVENGEVIARHKTVVGALKTPTPQLSATVTAVTFNPWWTVPQSIVKTMSGFGGYEVRQGNGYRSSARRRDRATRLGASRSRCRTSMRSTCTTRRRRASSTRIGAPTAMAVSAPIISAALRRRCCGRPASGTAARSTLQSTPARPCRPALRRRSRSTSPISPRRRRGRAAWSLTPTFTAATAACARR
jgi:hypothetical protein